MKIYFKESIPESLNNRLIKEIGIGVNDIYYRSSLMEKYYYEIDQKQKEESDYIVYFLSVNLMLSDYYSEIAMQIFLDLESFSKKVVIINLTDTNDKIMTYLLNKAGDFHGYCFDRIGLAVNFLRNKKIEKEAVVRHNNDQESGSEDRCSKCEKVRKLTKELMGLRCKIQAGIALDPFYRCLKDIEKDNLEKLSEIEKDWEDMKEE